jgi:hypothetical protein
VQSEYAQSKAKAICCPRPGFDMVPHDVRYVCPTM